PEHNRPEALESWASESRVLREQEIAAPKTLPCDRAVRLPVDGENDTRRVVRLRHAPHNHQYVPVRVGKDGSRPQRLLPERHGIIISVVVAQGRPRGTGVYAVGYNSNKIAERRRQAQPLWRRRGRWRRRKGAPRRSWDRRS